ncbi:MAG: prepilin-type N-terminal cleavage/methylation domain-containing protein [Nitrospinae bacterium]|nr:prepilin-type N-terminal cleavage/methylation domain-containing protein [Nitrospinota bacterium]
MNRAGYTLIELVAVLVVLAALGAFSVNGVANSVDVYNAAIAENSLAQETWIAMERIRRELAEADVVSTPASGASSSNLVFTRPSAATCGQCVDRSTSVTFTFDQASGTLDRATQQSGAAILADSVTAFTASVSADTAALRVFTITLTRADRKTGRSFTAETSIFPPASRNATWRETVQ